MAGKIFFICSVFLFCCPFTEAGFFIVPEDVAMLFTTIYGFAPPVRKGNDHRIGFGYSFGNHADVQVLYEFGPQFTTKKLNSVGLAPIPRIRNVRRPLIDLLLRRGNLKDASKNYKIAHEKSK